MQNISAANITVSSDLASFSGNDLVIVSPPYASTLIVPTIADYSGSNTSQPLVCANVTGIGNLVVNVGGSLILNNVLQSRTGNLTATTTGKGLGDYVSILLNSGAFFGTFYLQAATISLDVQGYILSTESSGNSEQGSLGTGCQILVATTPGQFALSTTKLPIMGQLSSFVGPLLLTQSSEGGADLMSASCGGQYAPDYILLWTPPGSGMSFPRTCAR